MIKLVPLSFLYIQLFYQHHLRQLVVFLKKKFEFVSRGFLNVLWLRIWSYIYQLHIVLFYNFVMRKRNNICYDPRFLNC